MKYYVYAYLDPRKPGKYTNEFITFLYEPIYVGKGCGDRCYRHLTREDVHPFVQKIAKIKSSGQEPIVFKLAFYDDAQKAFDFEEKLIRDIGFNGAGSLTNIYAGGQGMKGGAEHPFYGKHHTIDARKKISEALSKRVYTEEMRERKRIRQTGKPHKFNYWGLLNDDGERTGKINVMKFCIANSLNYKQVLRDAKAGVSHHGFTFYKIEKE